MPVRSVPEIQLHRAQPSSGLRRLAERDHDGFDSPYWAYPWPGGVVLARYILDHPQVVAGRRVLDLGAGSGLVAIAAAKAGAREVITADIDPYAACALRLNATANGVDLSVVTDDLTQGPMPRVDVVLVGDLFYAAALAAKVTACLDRCVAGGIDVLVGDIGRVDLPHAKLRRIAEYPAVEFGESSGTGRTAAVFQFGRSA